MGSRPSLCGWKWEPVSSVGLEAPFAVTAKQWVYIGNHAHLLAGPPENRELGHTHRPHPCTTSGSLVTFSEPL